MKKILLLITFFVITESISAQFVLYRKDISFYIDNELITKEKADSIDILIWHNNKIHVLKDSLFLGYDKSLVNLIFFIDRRPMTIEGLTTNYFFEGNKYKLGYNYFDNLKFVYEFEDDLFMKGKFKRIHKFFYKRLYNSYYYINSGESYSIFIPSIKLGSSKLKKEDVIRGIAWFVPEHNRVLRKFHDFKTNIMIKP